MLDRIIKTVFPWLLTHSILCWQLLCKFDALTFYLFMGNKFNVLRPVKEDLLTYRKPESRFSNIFFNEDDMFVRNIFFVCIIFYVMYISFEYGCRNLYTTCIQNVMQNIIHFCVNVPVEIVGRLGNMYRQSWDGCVGVNQVNVKIYFYRKWLTKIFFTENVFLTENRFATYCPICDNDNDMCDIEKTRTTFKEFVAIK